MAFETKNEWQFE